MKRDNKTIKKIISSLIVLPVIVIMCSVVAYGKEDKKAVPMDLNGTEWMVEMVFVTSKGKKNMSDDTLLFADKKFISDGFDKKGYEPTNYSLTVEEDGSTRFGTMQIKGKETSFWKGKVKGDKIDGSVHTQFSNNTTSTTYFSGTLTSGALKPKVKTQPKFPTPTPEPPPTKIMPVVPAQPVVEEVSEIEAAPEVVAEVVQEAAPVSDDEVAQ